jgi:transcription antitermination factor NusG
MYTFIPTPLSYINIMTTAPQKMQKATDNNGINHLDATEPRWFAIYTGFRKEKAVKELLDRKKIHSYLPLQGFRREYGRKVTHVELPLINCYLFVKITTHQYVPVLETEYVHTFVKFSRDLISIPEQEITWLKRILEDETIVSELIEDPSSFEEGDKVEVLSGRLAGLQGRLLHKHGKQSFMVEFKAVGQSLNLTIDSDLLRKI